MSLQYTGTLEHWNTGTLVHWYTGTLVHWYTVALVNWYTGTLLLEYTTGTLVFPPFHLLYALYTILLFIHSIGVYV